MKASSRLSSTRRIVPLSFMRTGVQGCHFGQSVGRYGPSFKVGETLNACCSSSQVFDASYRLLPLDEPSENANVEYQRMLRLLKSRRTGMYWAGRDWVNDWSQGRR